MSVFPEFSFPFNDLDDGDFNLAIYEMQNGPVRYDADRLASLTPRSHQRLRSRLSMLSCDVMHASKL